MQRSVFMGTTGVASRETVSEICAVLIRGGARSISQDYGDNGKPIAIQFVMFVNGIPVRFALPARIQVLYDKMLSLDRTARKRGYVDKIKLRQQAEMTTWRQLLRWVEAQIALVETGMAKAAEVFLPYARAADGRTLFEFFEAEGVRLLSLGAQVQSAQAD